MKNREILLSAMFSIAFVFSLIVPASAAGTSVAVLLPDDRSISHSAVDSSSLASAMALNTPQGNVTPMVAAGQFHTVGLKSDGTVVALGFNGWGECNVSGWTDIIQVAAGFQHTVGVRADGTMVAVGANYGQCNVGGWTDIIQVSAGAVHTVGLKSDGTVVALGDNGYRECNVGGWKNIIQVAAGWCHTVGLKASGRVVAVGYNDCGQRNVGRWRDIVQVAAGYSHTVGLKSDGTVVAAGSEIELAKWNLGVIEYALTISSTAGGSVTTPDEGVFTYNAGVMVRVVAKPEKGYRFVNWTGDVDTIANVNATTTMISMRGDYSITANFKEKPPINWALIGGIIAAVAIVGLVILFVRRKRKAA
jgi:uncharacterized repeat protein (TIGR02543 family)